MPGPSVHSGTLFTAALLLPVTGRKTTLWEQILISLWGSVERFISCWFSWQFSLPKPLLQQRCHLKGTWIPRFCNHSSELDTEALNLKTLATCTTAPHSFPARGPLSCGHWAGHPRTSVILKILSSRSPDSTKKGSQAHRACQDSCWAGARQAFPSSAPQRDRPAVARQCSAALFGCHPAWHVQLVSGCLHLSPHMAPFTRHGPCLLSRRSSVSC